LPAAHVPQSDDAAAVRHEQPFAIGEKHDGAVFTLALVELSNFIAARRVPQSNPGIARADGEELAIGRKGQIVRLARRLGFRQG
jgi:hypothetical protein